MSFISSFQDRFKDRVIVWERTDDGKRVIREYKSPYYFYVPQKDGAYESVTGEKLAKLTFPSKGDFEQAVHSYPKRFESDLTPLEKVMMDNYAGRTPPKLVYGFLDIEVDYDPNVGFPRPGNPYAPVNSLTLYNTNTKAYVTYCVPPPGWNRIGCRLPDSMVADNYVVCSDETELLKRFMEDIEPIDIVSGWNSEFFDMPYLGKRIELLFGTSGMRKLGFDMAPAPRWGEAERFKGGAKEIVLDLMSRVHLDYMRLFKKFNLEGRQSYSLAAIAADEIDVDKMTYDGTLYELYHGTWSPNLNALKPAEEWDELYQAQVERAILAEDMGSDAYREADRIVKQLSFIKFITYNRVDVTVIVKLDQKFKYLDLANAMVHEATVNFGSIFGSVQLIDTAIINFCHLKLKKIVFDRTHRPKQQVEGALVMSPRIGLHRMIGSVDINSLYPSTYRSLNLSPEKIVGQFMGYEDDWRAIYKANKDPGNDLLKMKKVTLRLEGSGPDEDLEMTVGDALELLKERKFAVSGYGTVLDQGNGEGLLPAVLTYWFVGRKEMQAEKKKYAKQAKEVLSNGGSESDSAYLEANRLSEYYDMLQGVRKVLLNSTYGATLNEFCRFHDPRLGASTTGSGRQITTYMIETIAACLIADNPPKVKKHIEFDKKTGENVNTYTIDCPPGLGPIYSDTDSCYFSMDLLVQSAEEAVLCADAVADQVNESFPSFMMEAFLCQPQFSDKIRAAREMVAVSGIFRAKKKYMMYVHDMEGTRIPPDSPKALKTQGSDIKISSTPEMIRGMLKDVTMMILKGVDKKEIDDYIIKFRANLTNVENNDLNILEFATVTSVRTYDEYATKWERIEKPGLGRVTMPANVRAAVNYNHFIKMKDLTDERAIMAGDKIKMLWLEENEWGFTNFAFSSDVDELPKWFHDNFKVDIKSTEQKLIDQKLGNIFDPIGWQVPTLKTQLMNKLLSFD